jgi:hypothetical protein
MGAALMVDQLEIAKEALAQIGTRSKITSLTDGSAEAQYVGLLYAPIRDFLLTEGDYDWSMLFAPLTASTGGSFPWAFAYNYPVGALRIRQLIPLSYDPLDPRPVEWTVSGIGGERTILASEEMVEAVYVAPAVETLWDSIFRQSFVRMLSSALAFALENRIEASKVKLDEALGFAGVGKMRDM